MVFIPWFWDFKTADPVLVMTLEPTSKLGTEEHTLRDKSQVGGGKKDSKNRVVMDFCKNGSFSIRNE